MIREVTMYQAVCDGCGRPCVKTGGIMAWTNRESARIVAWESGWLLVNHETYCPDCYEYDEETHEYKPKAKETLERSKRLERDVDKVIKDALRAMEERRNPTLGI